uniref:Uncharacterized protein n=2 Tax=Picea TaxID=3328 RepID=A0A117NHY4_PICGL|nr:hypothetical protein ABT39_MTgene3647 [Picea glauca]QHR89815.1 hypothetical protein Q903MT_gene3837 [Picea sitchensis]
MHSHRSVSFPRRPASLRIVGGGRIPQFQFPASPLFQGFLFTKSKIEGGCRHSERHQPNKRTRRPISTGPFQSYLLLESRFNVPKDGEECTQSRLCPEERKRAEPEREALIYLYINLRNTIPEV